MHCIYNLFIFTTFFSDDANQNIPSGSILCDLLMKVHEMVISKPGDNLVHLSGNALKCLLAISSAAKETALKGKQSHFLL